MLYPTINTSIIIPFQGVGIWYIFPDEPLGPSRALNLMDKYEARSTRLLHSDNNVVHSYKMVRKYLNILKLLI